MKTISPRIIRQIFTLLLVLLLGGLIFKEMLPYLSGVLGAITLYVLLKGWMAKLLHKNWSPNVAASFLMFMSFISILLPITGAIMMLGNKIGKAAKNSERLVAAVKLQLSKWEHYLGFNITDQLDASSISENVTSSITSILGGTFSTLIAISIMYFLLFYMLKNRNELSEYLTNYIPIGENNVKTLATEVNGMVRSNALGIPLVAMAQGIVALIGFLIFGVESPFFWALVVTIGSMIPFVGNFLGTIPVFIIAISNGEAFQAWGVLLYGIVVVGVTDNFIRLYVLNKLDDVHPLITLVGVLIGIPLFGFIGLIFGPLLISLFLLLIKIYKNEYGKEHSRL